MELDEALEYLPPFDRKHTGKTLGEIAEADPLYVDWYLNLKDLRYHRRFRDAVRLVAEKFEDAIGEAKAGREDDDG